MQPRVLPVNSRQCRSTHLKLVFGLFHFDMHNGSYWQVILEPSSYTEEKYELFRTYQLNIHSDDRSTPSGFSRFLVESPLTVQYTS